MAPAFIQFTTMDKLITLLATFALVGEEGRREHSHLFRTVHTLKFSLLRCKRKKILYVFFVYFFFVNI